MIPEQHLEFLHAVWTRRTPYTYFFFGLNIFIFILMALAGGSTNDSTLMAFGVKANSAIDHGQWWRFVTPMFLHIGLLHLIFNSYALWIVGPQVEKLYGGARFVILYVLTGVAAVAASFHFRPDGESVGASGAIFGLIGGLAAFYYVARGVLGDVSRQQLGSLITVIMINLFIGFSAPIIDNTAHIGGLIGGAAVGWMLAPRFALDERLYPPEIVRRSWPLAWPGALGLLALLVILVMVINPPIR